MTQPRHRSHLPDHRDNGADIIPFRLRPEEGELNPEELTLAECASFFAHKWNHPSSASQRISDIINQDANSSRDNTDRWKERLQKAISESPLFDYYDEIIEADPVTRLFDSLMRSTMPSRGSLSNERKALSNLMYLRATEVIDKPGDDLSPQLQRLPIGDEEIWETLARRIAAEQ